MKTLYLSLFFGIIFTSESLRINGVCNNDTDGTQ